MGELVTQLNPTAYRPMLELATLLQVGVLRTGSGNEAHPAGDGMAPAQINDVVINLAAGILRKLKQLKAVDGADLVVPGKQVAVTALHRDLVAVDQKRRIGGVEEMSVAESTRDGDRGARIESLNGVENRRVREPGNVSDRTHLTVEDHAGQTTIQPCGAPAAGNTQTRDAPKGADGEGAVGEVTEGVAQRHLASSPAGDGFKAGGVHLPHLIRTAVERSAAEVFEKNITL